jgi:hypothetical protein
LLQKLLGSNPFFIHKPIEDLFRKTAPNIVLNVPSLFLEQRGKLRFLKPEDFKDPVIASTVLRASYALEILVIQPIHIRVRIPWVT